VALKIQPEDSGLLNNLAWVLATSPEDELRDGQRALELATKACELTDYEEAHILSTLASTYAELGDFDTAVKWSEKAVEAGEGETKNQLKEELESYREQKPWREKQETKEKVELPKANLLET
jgi:tetratricopeptide (TPR) repeat protein